MKNKKVKLIAGTSATAVAVLGIGAFALFTDNDTDGTASKAGTVEVDLGDVNLENSGNINPGDHDEDIPDTYIPDPDDPLYKDEDGDGEGDPVEIVTTPHHLTFEVANTGTKSIRTRQTLIVTCKQVIETEEGPQEVVLDPTYLSLLIEDGVELGSKTGIGIKTYVLEDGTEVATLPEEEEVKVTAIKYQLTPDIFDGVGDSAEIEETSTVKNVDDISSKLYTYMLKMDSETPNEYQGATISIDIVVEAMQYRNTANTDWETMTTKTVSGVVTGLVQNTVPDRAE